MRRVAMGAVLSVWSSLLVVSSQGMGSRRHEDRRGDTSAGRPGWLGCHRVTILLVAGLVLFTSATQAASSTCEAPCNWQYNRFRELVSRSGVDLPRPVAANLMPDLQVSRDVSGGNGSAETQEPSVDAVLAEPQSSWDPPRSHFFLRFGGDGAMGPYLEIGPGLSGYWGVQNLLAEVFFTMSGEFALDKFFADLMEDWFSTAIGWPEELTIFPAGQAVGAGAKLRIFTESTHERGAHAFGIGVGATALVTESYLGASVTILGQVNVSASWPFVEVGAYYRIPLESTNGDLLTALKKGTIGVSFGLRDPLSPLIEVFRKLRD